MRVLHVGGVDEPFNLPWLLASEANAYDDLGVEVTYTNYAGGTGALITALESGEIDLATILTEGAVTAIGRGSDVRLHSAFVVSPLRWGIHVAAGADVGLADLEGRRFAISRFGSGSELMAYVLADREGWQLDADHFVEVGGVQGAIDALPAGNADIFLWERFVTAPLVTQGIFGFVGEIPTPWPSFYLAARPGLLGQDRELVDRVVLIALGFAAGLKADPDAAVAMIADRYGMDPADTREWLAGAEWPTELVVDAPVLDSVVARMVDLGRLDTAIPASDLV